MVENQAITIGQKYLMLVAHVCNLGTWEADSRGSKVMASFTYPGSAFKRKSKNLNDLLLSHTVH